MSQYFAEMRRLHESGESVDRIAEQFKMSPLYVRLLFRQNGIHLETLSDRISIMYQSGKTCTQIANKMNLPRRKVIRLLREAGVQLRSPGRHCIVDARTLAKMYQLYVGGMTMQQIAEQFHVSCSVVQYHFTAMKLKIRKTGKPANRARLLEMKQLYEQGYSIAQVAARYKVTASTIYQLFRRHRIPVGKGRVRA